MQLSTDNLVLKPDAAIDLQVHTHFSDGTWQPEALIEYLKQETFELAAITDHDRVDTLKSLQELAIKNGFHLLVAVEMTCRWQDQMTDVLCYGFDPENNHLAVLADDVGKRQRENSQQIFDILRKKGFEFEPDEVNTVLNKPSSAHLQAVFDLVNAAKAKPEDVPTGKIMLEAGFEWATHDIAVVVDAVHKSDGVCLIAHPGRSDGFICYDSELLDQLRQTVPIDGIEVHYPIHTPEQTAMFLAYAEKHDLLMSSGSDSHNSDKKPIKYPASYSQKLLERVGIQIQ